MPVMECTACESTFDFDEQTDDVAICPECGSFKVRIIKLDDGAE